MSDQIWLIWSNEHGAWWRPGERGYTRVISQAGRYSQEGATVICANANHFQPKHEEPNEVMVRADGIAPPRVRSYTCPKCGATSYHPMDVKNLYCGRCHRFEVDA